MPGAEEVPVPPDPLAKPADPMVDELRKQEVQRAEGVLPEPILQYFVFEHLPLNLQPVSRLFSDLAHQLVRDLPRNPERSVALRKLLEGKDAAVRAAFTK